MILRLKKGKQDALAKRMVQLQHHQSERRRKERKRGVN